MRKTPQNCQFSSVKLIIYHHMLCLIIFLWTPPHSWALAIYRMDDYSNADVPMYPIKYGIKKTITLMNLYTALMVISVNLLFFLGYTNSVFFISANILNIIFILKLLKVNKSKNLKIDSIKLFGFSIVYLFLIFLFAVLDKFLI